MEPGQSGYPGAAQAADYRGTGQEAQPLLKGLEPDRGDALHRPPSSP
jgi:hypothetical protein